MRPTTVLIKTMICGCMILGLASACLAKDWRGIVPLRSTRADVERLLGVPTEKSAARFYYRLSDELAVIWFQMEPCDQCGLGWNVAPETVISIGVIPRSVHGRRKPLDLNRFKMETANAGFVYYWNEHDGLTIETFKGEVTSVDYDPEENQGNRRCHRKDCIVDFFPRFDEYATLSWADEKARLDNFAIRLKNDMGRGSIVVYGRSPAERDKQIERASRARKHLKKVGIEPERILIVDGGYRDKVSFELNTYSIGGFANRIYLFPQNDPKSSKTENDLIKPRTVLLTKAALASFSPPSRRRKRPPLRGQS